MNEARNERSDRLRARAPASTNWWAPRPPSVGLSTSGARLQGQPLCHFGFLEPPSEQRPPSHWRGRESGAPQTGLAHGEPHAGAISFKITRGGGVTLPSCAAPGVEPLVQPRRRGRRASEFVGAGGRSGAAAPPRAAR